MRKLINIYSTTLSLQESKAFSYRPSTNQKKAIGLLISNDTSVSLSFENNQSLTVNQMMFAYRDEVKTMSPNKRAIQLEEDLTQCKVITGTITNEKTVHQNNEKRTVSIYLIIEKSN